MNDVISLDKIISECKRIVLVGHPNPDGDCIGALTGLMRFLQNIGKEVNVAVPNRYPQFLQFLDKNNEIIDWAHSPLEVESAFKNADLIFCVDFNNTDRVEALSPLLLSSSAKKVLVDHHPNPSENFTILFSRTDVSSASELTYYLLKSLDKLLIDRGNSSAFDFDICVSLYTGMMTDTNNFSNSVYGSTFEMASQLLNKGVDKEYIQNQVFGGFSEDRMRLMGYMLNDKMNVFPQLHASVMVLDKAAQHKYNYQDGDSEGFVNLGLSIKGVYIAALFTETDKNIRVSLRSRDKVTVNILANKYFNGGGHIHASGGKLFDIGVNDVEQFFVKSLTDFYKENGIKF